MVDGVNLGLTGGGQTCDHHGCTCTQVTGLHLGSGEALHALDHSNLTVHLDLGTHTAEFLHIAVTVVPHAFGHHTGALCQTQASGDLGLHIGGKTGVGHGLDIGAVQRSGAAHQNGIVPLLHIYAHFQQLCSDALQMLGNDILNQNLTTSRSHGSHVGAGFDLVGDNGIASALELLHAADLDHIGTRTHDVGTHGVEEIGQIHDMRLLGGILDDGHALGQGGGQHDVHGCAHGNNIQIDLTALEPSTGHIGVDQAVFDLYLSAHGLKALDVLVDGTAAQVAAAGGRHLRPAKAAQQSAHQIVAGADLTGQLVGDGLILNTGTIDVQRGAVHSPHIGTQLLHDLQDQGHVTDLGNIFNTALSTYQQGSRQNGYGGILGAADLNGAVQRLTAANQILGQCGTLFKLSKWGIFMKYGDGTP